MVILDKLPENTWNVIRNDALTLLSEADLVEVNSHDGFSVEIISCESFKALYRLIRNCIRDANSTRRLVAWALLRFLKSGNLEIEVEDIIWEISYPDEVYESLLKDQVFGSNVLRVKPFLLSNPTERIEYVTQKHEKNEDSAEIIQKIRGIEKEEILKIFPVLGLNENELLQTKSLVKKELEECYGAMWPSFGRIQVQDKCFKLFGGQSSTLYVDVPNSMMERVID